MRSSSTSLPLPLSHHPDSTLEVRGELRVNNRDVFAVTFSCNNLTNKDGFFGTSDPFITMSRMNEDGSHTVVWKSDVIDNSLNPRWKEATISVVQLCNNDLHRPIILEVFGKHLYIYLYLIIWYMRIAKHARFSLIQTAIRVASMRAWVPPRPPCTTS
ncbi:hypothetical protein EON65_29530 [archaeon]|nr:MAG: hypothetical protein EON65_29530 [archaeon]